MRAMGRLLTAVLAAMAVCWVAGCAKKTEREAVPETRDTLSEIPNTLIDTRDGKAYKTVVFGGKMWMGENLNYQPQTGNYWCYGDDNFNCGRYGRLYDWETAKTVCPGGWHLSAREEWDDWVEKASGSGRKAGKKLKARIGWNDYGKKSGNGTDNYGFSALPGGGRGSDGSFVSAGDHGYWWTTTEGPDGDAYNYGLYYYDDYLNESHDDKDLGFSVRCVRDAD